MSDIELDPQDDDAFDLEREPLYPPQAFDIDWGGDGSNPMRSVRAHVLAALRPSAGPYPPPLDALLTLGDVGVEELEWRSADLGIGQAHVPELLRMLRDRTLNTIDSDTPAVYAPGHALDLLDGLDLSDVVAELIPLFDVDFDQIGERLPGVLGNVGAPAIAPLRDYLEDQARWVWGHSRAADALKEIAEQHPALRAEVVELLSDVLAAADAYHAESVTGVVGALINLRATEALSLIRRAFEREKVDEVVYGPWGDVQRKLGVEPEAGDPLVEVSLQRFEERHAQVFPPDLKENLAAFQAQQRMGQAKTAQQAASQKRKQDKARKEKNKRKASSAARKTNRKKRK